MDNQNQIASSSKQQIAKIFEKSKKEGSPLDAFELNTMSKLIYSEEDLIKSASSLLLVYLVIRGKLKSHLPRFFQVEEVGGGRFWIREPSDIENTQDSNLLDFGLMACIVQTRDGGVTRLDIREVEDYLEDFVSENKGSRVVTGRIGLEVNRPEDPIPEIEDAAGGSFNKRFKEVEVAYELSEGETSSEEGDDSSISCCSLEESDMDSIHSLPSPRKKPNTGMEKQLSSGSSDSSFRPLFMKKIPSQFTSEKGITINRQGKNTRQATKIDSCFSSFDKDEEELKKRKEQRRKEKMKYFVEKYKANLKSDYSSIRPSIFAKYKPEKSILTKKVESTENNCNWDTIKRKESSEIKSVTNKCFTIKSPVKSRRHTKSVGRTNIRININGSLREPHIRKKARLKSSDPRKIKVKVNKFGRNSVGSTKACSKSGMFGQLSFPSSKKITRKNLQLTPILRGSLSKRANMPPGPSFKITRPVDFKLSSSRKPKRRLNLDFRSEKLIKNRFQYSEAFLDYDKSYQDSVNSSPIKRRGFFLKKKSKRQQTFGRKWKNIAE